MTLIHSAPYTQLKQYFWEPVNYLNIFYFPFSWILVYPFFGNYSFEIFLYYIVIPNGSKRKDNLFMLPLLTLLTTYETQWPCTKSFSVATHVQNIGTMLPLFFTKLTERHCPLCLPPWEYRNPVIYTYIPLVYHKKLIKRGPDLLIDRPCLIYWLVALHRNHVLYVYHQVNRKALSFRLTIMGV